ncbi:hypothetical protein VTI74DRAFT_1218 [Chaetomium olivicolor]
MGRQADEHLPEVVPHQPQPSPLPEVMPDSSPEAAQQRFYMETDKYPAYYDTAPKMPHEQPPPGMSPQSQYQQQWVGPGDPVSAISPNSSVPWQSFPHGGDDQQTYVGSEPEPEKRICGMRKKIFIIVAIILGIVVVAAAVGGGVGGSRAAKKGTDNEAQPAETAPATSASLTPTTITGSLTSTTSSAPTPTITSLNSQIDPSVFQRGAFQGWSEANFTGNATKIYHDEGYFDFSFNVTSYIWLRNDTSCCVSFCANKTSAVGWWCANRRREKSDDKFSGLRIWCGQKDWKQCQ